MRRPRPLIGPALLVCGLSAALAAGQDPEPPNPFRPAGKKVKGGAQPPAPAPSLSDEQALKQFGLDPADGPKLLAYLRERTLTDVEQGRVDELIRRLGSDDFDDRDRASAELERVGASAVGPLKKAEKDPDPEVAYRARLALRRMEQVPHAAATAAAVRAVARLRPEGAAAALVGYLPLTDSEVLADTIRETLVALAAPDGKADPALVAALADQSPVRRAAAYVALTEGGDPAERVRVKDAYPKVRRAVLAEADPEARFVGLWSLALTTREPEYVPELIRVLPKVGRGRLWQAEDFLLGLAGAHPDGGRFGRSAEDVARAADAWLGWWKAKGSKADLAAFRYAPRVRGFTDLVEADNRATGQSRVVGLGPDLKERWRFAGLSTPTDVRVAADGNVWVVEAGKSQVTERDPSGAVLTTRNVYQQPLNLDLLPDGGMVVVCRNQVVKLNKDGSQAWAHPRPNDILAGRRLPGGETVFVTGLYQQPKRPAPNLFRVDADGKEVKPAAAADPKGVAVGYVTQMHAMGSAGDDRVLVCERDTTNRAQPVDRVAEYEVRTGKLGWKYDCPPNSAPTSAQRLPNGNTLICLMNQNRLIEVGPGDEVVWEYQAKDGLQVGRAYRR